VVIEQSNAGIDTVRSYVDGYRLTDNVENLTLSLASNSVLTGTGNDLSNEITGNLADNVLFGLGGHDTLNGYAGSDRLYGQSGNDRLIGGGGNDRLFGGNDNDAFVFDVPLNAATNVDTIVDFNHADDTIVLDSHVFTTVVMGLDGTLRPDEFINGTAARDANDHIIYDGDTGALFYDADGTGSAAAIQFATLGAHLAIDHTDFTHF
jgi:serralysin